MNTNGLAQAVATAISEGSNFYTLTYSPSDPSANGKFRKIKSSSAQKGLQSRLPARLLRRRSRKEPSVSRRQTPEGRWHHRLRRERRTNRVPHPARCHARAAAPTPTQILLKVSVRPVGPPDRPKTTIAPRNVLRGKGQGPFRRYSVDYAAAPPTSAFLRGSDGKNSRRLRIRHLSSSTRTETSSTSQRTRPIQHRYRSARRHQKGRRQRHSLPSGDQRPRQRATYYPPHRSSTTSPRDRFGAVEVATSSVKNLRPLRLLHRPTCISQPSTPAPAATAPKVRSMNRS